MVDIEFQTIFKYVIVNGTIGMFWLLERCVYYSNNNIVSAVVHDPKTEI